MRWGRKHPLPGLSAASFPRSGADTALCFSPGTIISSSWLQWLSAPHSRSLSSPVPAVLGWHRGRPTPHPDLTVTRMGGEVSITPR